MQADWCPCCKTVLRTLSNRKTMKRLLLLLAIFSTFLVACADIDITIEAPVDPSAEDNPNPQPENPIEDDQPNTDSDNIVTNLPGDAEIAEVIWVVDGDTIEVLLDGVEYRVRYIGIDTPEFEETCYTEATNANAAFVEGQDVYLVKDVSETDRFDRLLRYIYVPANGGFVQVNEALVAAGYARAVEFPPDTSFADVLNAAEADAAGASVGCWSVPGFQGF